MKKLSKKKFPIFKKFFENILWETRLAIIIKVKSTNCEVIIRSMSAAGIWGKFVLPKKVVTGTKRSSVPISIEILLSTCIN